MSKLRWAKLWWSDWENDPALRQCSLAAQGLWMRLLCLAAQSRIYGVVLVAGQPPTAGELAKIVGDHHRRVDAKLRELESRKVFNRTPINLAYIDDNCPINAIYSRRMVADYEEHQRKRRAGLSGGNPALIGGHDDDPNDGMLKQPLKHNTHGLLKVEVEEEVKHKEESPRTPPPGGAARTRNQNGGEKKNSQNANIDLLAEELADAKSGNSAPVVPFPRRAISS
jgi:hypothetical protein